MVSNEEDNQVRLEIPRGVYMPDELYDLIDGQLQEPMYNAYGREGLGEMLPRNVQMAIQELVDRGIVNVEKCNHWLFSSLVPECEDIYYVSKGQWPMPIDVVHDGGRTWNINSLRAWLRHNYDMTRFDALYVVEDWIGTGQLRRVAPATYRFKSRTAPFPFEDSWAYVYKIEPEVPDIVMRMYMGTIAWKSGGGGYKRSRSKYDVNRVIKIYVVMYNQRTHQEKYDLMYDIINNVLVELGYPDVSAIVTWHPPDSGKHLDLLQMPDVIREHGRWEYIKDGDVIDTNVLSDIALLSGISNDEIDKHRDERKDTRLITEGFMPAAEIEFRAEEPEDEKYESEKEE